MSFPSRASALAYAESVDRKGVHRRTRLEDEARESAVRYSDLVVVACPGLAVDAPVAAAGLTAEVRQLIYLAAYGKRGWWALWHVRATGKQLADQQELSAFRDARPSGYRIPADAFKWHGDGERADAGRGRGGNRREYPARVCYRCGALFDKQRGGCQGACARLNARGRGAGQDRDAVGGGRGGYGYGADGGGAGYGGGGRGYQQRNFRQQQYQQQQQFDRCGRCRGMSFDRAQRRCTNPRASGATARARRRGTGASRTRNTTRRPMSGR